MQIPTGRLDAAFWVYQSSVLAALIMIMSIPYNATIIAHERMSAFACISAFPTILHPAKESISLIKHLFQVNLIRVSLKWHLQYQP